MTQFRSTGPAPRPARLLSRLCATLLLAAGATGAWAQPPPSTADVERLLVAARAQSLLDTMLPQMEAMQQQQFAQVSQGRELNDRQRAQLDRIQAKTSDILRRALAWEEMRPLYIDLYQKTFSKQDVEAMTAFYESAAGRSLLDKTPALMQNLMGAIQVKMMPLFKELEGELRQIAAEDTGGAADTANTQERKEATSVPNP